MSYNRRLTRTPVPVVVGAVAVGMGALSLVPMAAADDLQPTVIGVYLIVSNGPDPLPGQRGVLFRLDNGEIPQFGTNTYTSDCVTVTDSTGLTKPAGGRQCVGSYISTIVGRLGPGGSLPTSGEGVYSYSDLCYPSLGCGERVPYESISAWGTRLAYADGTSGPYVPNGEGPAPTPGQDPGRDCGDFTVTADEVASNAAMYQYAFDLTESEVNAYRDNPCVRPLITIGVDAGNGSEAAAGEFVADEFQALAATVPEDALQAFVAPGESMAARVRLKDGAYACRLTWNWQLETTGSITLTREGWDPRVFGDDILSKYGELDSIPDELNQLKLLVAMAHVAAGAKIGTRTPGTHLGSVVGELEYSFYSGVGQKTIRNAEASVTGYHAGLGFGEEIDEEFKRAVDFVDVEVKNENYGGLPDVGDYGTSYKVRFKDSVIKFDQMIELSGFNVAYGGNINLAKLTGGPEAQVYASYQGGLDSLTTVTERDQFNILAARLATSAGGSVAIPSDLLPIAAVKPSAAVSSIGHTCSIQPSDLVASGETEAVDPELS